MFAQIAEFFANVADLFDVVDFFTGSAEGLSSE